MKAKMFMVMLVSGMAVMAGCDDKISVNSDVQTAFTSRYPDAQRVEWEMKAGYYVADFYLSGVEAEAWYSQGGVWQMTETDIPYDALPAAVRTAFESGEYAGWQKEDVDKLERQGLETVYVIEVEQGEAEYDLYYSEDGVLIKAVPDDGGGLNYLPSTPPSSVEEYIATNYPDARIVEKEVENGMIEVDIIDGGISRELIFSLTGEWHSTKTEILPTAVPDIVLQTLNASYANWRIDDVGFYQTAASGDYYKFELEQGEREIDVRINTAGTILQ